MYHTAERPLFIEMIRNNQQEYNRRAEKAGKGGQVPERDPAKNLFEIHTGKQWLQQEKLTPPVGQLCGELWYQGELCIMFADTNVGKSILAVQIGNALARREPIGPFGVETDGPLKVLYIDFEMSGKQFQSRYTYQDVLFDFSEQFFRAGFNPNANMHFSFDSYDDYMSAAIEYAIKKTEATVLIIDNITCLREGTEHTSQALALMKNLKALKTKHNLSVLVLAHTPKRNPSKPITRDDLQGSKMLINCADSAFAIGESHTQKGIRYLKQVKQRNTREIYGADNVILWRITRPANFISYEFIGYGQEYDHLRTYNHQQRQLMIDQITQLHAQGLSQRQISRKLSMSLTAVNRVVQMVGE
jgi:hypothetical protein